MRNLINGEKNIRRSSTREAVDYSADLTESLHSPVRHFRVFFINQIKWAFEATKARVLGG